jgi:membrane protease YdiL (CAAX protease family)
MSRIASVPIARAGSKRLESPISACLNERSLETIIQAVFVGTAIVLVGTIPRNILFVANLRYGPAFPWAVPATALYLWFFWRYLNGDGPPESTAAQRRSSLRANRISWLLWVWALLAGGLAIAALLIGLQVANRFVALPQQQLPDLSKVPSFTMLSFLLAGAPIAGIIEESAFRGYMQGPIESRFGIVVAILVTGTMFALVHLDFTPILWPYYVAVAAIYGTVTYLTNSILPAIVLHTSGNIYSNTDLWLHGRAEWQRSAGPVALIWTSGPDRTFWMSLGLFTLVIALTTVAYTKLVTEARREKGARFRIAVKEV